MIPLSIRLEQDKFSRRRPSQGLHTALKVSDMNLQLVPVRIEEVERVTLAVILLPLLRSGVYETGAQGRIIRSRHGKRDVIVCRIQRAFRQFRFESQAYPEIARRQVRALILAGYGTKTHDFAVEAKGLLQIDDRKRYVIQARNHIQKPTPAQFGEEVL
jgi:hypothetical protein